MATRSWLVRHLTKYDINQYEDRRPSLNVVYSRITVILKQEPSIDAFLFSIRLCTSRLSLVSAALEANRFPIYLVPCTVHFAPVVVLLDSAPACCAQAVGKFWLGE